MAGFREHFLAHGAVLGSIDFPHSQLYNPPDSERNLFVTQITFGTDTVAVIQFNREPGVILSTQVDSISNMTMGSPTATRAEVRTEDRLTLVDGEFFATLCPYHTPIHHIPTVPILIPPGNSLIVTHTMKGSELFVNYEWQETNASYYATSY